jgi:hypothetical protein
MGAERASAADFARSGQIAVHGFRDSGVRGQRNGASSGQGPTGAPSPAYFYRGGADPAGDPALATHTAARGCVNFLGNRGGRAWTVVPARG